MDYVVAIEMFDVTQSVMKTYLSLQINLCLLLNKSYTETSVFDRWLLNLEITREYSYLVRHSFGAQG